MQIKKKLNETGDIKVTILDIPVLPLEGVRFEGSAWSNEDTDSLAAMSLTAITWGGCRFEIPQHNPSRFYYDEVMDVAEIGEVIMFRYNTFVKLVNEYRKTHDCKVATILSKPELLARIENETRLFYMTRSGNLAPVE